MVKIDKVDCKLIYALDQNARQNLNALARKLRISRNVAAYRMNRLKREGIVRGTFTEVNSIALGFHSFRVFLNLGNYEKSQKDSLILFLLARKNLTWLSEVVGKWDLDLVYTTKDICDFESFREELYLAFNHIIEQAHISILTQIHHYPKDYLLGKKRHDFSSRTLTPIGSTAIDEQDKKMLHALAGDASMSILELAKHVGLSINTAKRRLRNLEKKKIILGYRLLLDTNKLGFQYFKLHINLRRYSPSDILKLRSFLGSKNFVIYIDHYLSGEDFEIELHLKTEQEYLAFIEELYTLFGKIIKEKFLIKFHKEYLFRYLPEQ